MSNDKSMLDLAREIESLKANSNTNSTSQQENPKIDLKSVSEGAGADSISTRIHLGEKDKRKE